MPVVFGRCDSSILTVRHKKMKARQIFDFTYALHVLAGSVLVKANGEIILFLEQYQNWSTRGFGFFAIASVLIGLIFLSSALLYWQQKEFPLLAALFIFCIVAGGVVFSTAYLALAIFFAITWFFFKRQPPIFGNNF